MAKTVLMIEDFPVMQKFYKSALEEAGYTLDEANDGEAALTMVHDHEYDVILLDMLLPNVNGIEFLERFTARPPQTKIIVLSDFADEGRMKRAKELGAIDYLIKSDNPPSELVEKLKSLDESASSLT